MMRTSKSTCNHLMPPFVFATWCGQQSHGTLGSSKVHYPPFADVDDAELSTAEPAEPELSPPHAVNVVVTNMAAVACNALLKNETKAFICGFPGKKFSSCVRLNATVRWPRNASLGDITANCAAQGLPRTSASGQSRVMVAVAIGMVFRLILFMLRIS